jgi:hypothetical protein
MLELQNELKQLKKTEGDPYVNIRKLKQPLTKKRPVFDIVADVV